MLMFSNKKYSLIELLLGVFLVMLLPVTVSAQNFTDGTADAGTLPVRLLTFTGDKTDNRVVLKWVTAYEKNSSHFIVQRSLNGVEFYEIGKVQANGNSSTTQEYTFSDVTLPSGNLYYRLQQVDADGSTAYSAVVLIKSSRDKENGVSVYPNPVKGTDIRLLIDLPKARYQLRVFNAAGVNVYTRELLHPGGTGNIPLQLPMGVAKGVYTLQLTGGDQATYQQRIVVQ